MYCPANTHKKEINKDERLATETKCSLQIKKIFIEDFDVIAKIVNHYSDVYYSKKEKLELFKNAYNAKIWLFPKIDMSNIPWILLYCKSAEEIKQKLIKNDSNLYDFLKSKKVILKPSAKVKNYSFIKETVKQIIKKLKTCIILLLFIIDILIKMMNTKKLYVQF